MMKLHTGDNVVIISGKEKGKTGKVIHVLRAINRLVVEGVNMRTRHQKKTLQRPGQIVRYEASIHASNAMMVDPKNAKRTRIGIVCGEHGKQRVAKKSGSALERGKDAPKKQRREKEQTIGEEQVIKKKENTVREPFWKRAFRTGDKAIDGQEEGRNRQEEIDRSSVGSVRRSRESS
ncbi:50S ribosomal protein L24 [Candidatus Peribacteria bacterium RIFCSPLOWO2_12_FULL_55_15]|nr:MAG: 50S ribosomal protein L24 [Candidatus Peribacteria bacterium RIFCSPHIGHO2_01_FULL_54_22]OGJ63021.1 MAG: 50S ribosomal protein L24 [Candidatus Peribacteria bacterium RIFCSPHIGHO2_02_FULL_55_24]OGJ63925.1 MAG: 50S ribosomal protein L24 [Candidatus Peribacteria bacterium RIFCSPHIGHO2_12_FULL_54_10]OGJ68625.1 MAG: 50S ribosomal protein L24 [Candidatus Peribacteria bacterium RIFCSPLOWO2_01_FULL_54_110]OGJ68846.1 MAG: 50S ribosomal protein L24 [Candidatus Peribacteria bacterium RIFCSPLOWO2_02